MPKSHNFFTVLVSLLGDGLALVLGHLVVLDVLDLLAVLTVRPGQVDGLSNAEFLRIVTPMIYNFLHYWLGLCRFGQARLGRYG